MAEYHRIIFEEVYPWAGRFRQVGELAIVGGMVGAEWNRIERELSLLHAQSAELLAEAQSDADVVRALAFGHVRLERIHPFRDGNGRVGRVLLDGQLNAAFGSKYRPVLLRERYIAALQAAQKGNLATMVNVLAQREDVSHNEENFWAPFRLAPFPCDGAERTLAEDLIRSRQTGH